MIVSEERRLPDGFRIRLRDDVRKLDGGRLLVGGSPLHLLRVSDAARDRLRSGELQVTGPGSEVLASRLLDTNMADPVLQTGIDPDELTVVIPVRDRAQQLDRCLTALKPLRCIVVDDASHEAEAVLHVAHGHGAKTIQLGENQGPAAARNTGLRHVRTPYVAFVDSDVTVQPDTLLRLAGHFTDASVALVGPLVRGKIQSTRPRWFEQYDAAASSLDLGTTPSVVRPGARVAWLPSACLVARVDRLGSGFDESMRVGEDVDLVWRLVERGQVVRYDSSFIAWHDVRADVRRWLGRKFIYGTGGGALAVRHPDNVAPAILSPPMAAAAAALMLRRAWAAPLAVVVAARASRSLASRLPAGPHRGRVALQLAMEGLGWSLRQEAALVLRHWWPAALLTAVFNPSMRRVCLSALVVDAYVAAQERRDVRLPLKLVARRLDDLSYGLGLWIGAVQAGDLGCLRVPMKMNNRGHFPRRRSNPYVSQQARTADGQHQGPARTSLRAPIDL